jgi:hypothetical protein
MDFEYKIFGDFEGSGIRAQGLLNKVLRRNPWVQGLWLGVKGLGFRV